MHNTQSWSIRRVGRKLGGAWKWAIWTGSQLERMIVRESWTNWACLASRTESWWEVWQYCYFKRTVFLFLCSKWRSLLLWQGGFRLYFRWKLFKGVVWKRLNLLLRETVEASSVKVKLDMCLWKNRGVLWQGAALWAVPSDLNIVWLCSKQGWFSTASSLSFFCPVEQTTFSSSSW